MLFQKPVAFIAFLMVLALPHAMAVPQRYPSKPAPAPVPIPYKPAPAPYKPAPAPSKPAPGPPGPPWKSLAKDDKTTTNGPPPGYNQV